MESFMVQNADHVITLGPDLANELVRRGAEPTHLSIVPNGGDANRFSVAPNEAKDFAPIQQGELTAAYAGSLVAYEGLEVAIDAAAHLRERGRKLVLHIVGDGAVKHELEDRAKKLRLEDRIVFWGHQPWKITKGILAQAEVSLCPRKSNKITELVEGFKPIEGMLMGRVAVISDVSPHKALSQACPEGPLLFKADDARSLADVLEGVMNDTANSLVRNGEAGRAWALAHRSKEALSAKLDHALSQVFSS
jgi:glycosyltransferase involved in cell wall biosynthesis